MAEELIVTTSQRDDHQLDVTIELGPERTEQALQRAIKLVSKKARIPGFRPGKAPAAMIVRTYGKPGLLSEVVDDLSEEVYLEVLKSQQFEMYGQAALEDIQVEPTIQFKMVVPLRPEVDLGDYSGVRVEAPVVEVGDADVDALLEQAQAGRATHVAVDRESQIDDIVKVDIVGTVEDTTIMENEDWELTLRRDGGWLPGFDEAFVGLKAGDEKEFDITYPEDSFSKFKGKTAHFKAAVKEVRAKELPALDDEFARSLGDYADMADYRAKTLAELRAQRETEAENQLNQDAIDALVAQAKMAYPPAAVHDTVHEMLHDLENRMRNVGYTLEDSLRLQGKTVAQYEQELRPSAERRVKSRLVIDELGRRENLAVTSEEVDAELERIVGQSEEEETRKALQEAFGSESGRAMIEHDLLTTKTLERLRALVTGQAATDVAAAAPVAEVTETPSVVAETPDAAHAPAEAGDAETPETN